ncbi:MAG TPA: hypothetical protein VMY39_08150, partial [Planctomycetota bacterium]|nr:hypothetical protein [Planctomycetota bacterium]
FGSVKVVMVAPGQEKILDMGPPIGMVLISRTGQNVPPGIVRFTLGVVGRSSESYYPGAFLAGKKPPAPALRITDPDGKVLETVRFNVTAAGACSFDWRYPKDFTGPFDVKIDPVMGPFKWELGKQGTFYVE